MQLLHLVTRMLIVPGVCPISVDFFGKVYYIEIIKVGSLDGATVIVQGESKVARLVLHFCAGQTNLLLFSLFHTKT